MIIRRFKKIYLEVVLLVSVEFLSHTCPPGGAKCVTAFFFTIQFNYSSIVKWFSQFKDGRTDLQKIAAFLEFLQSYSAEDTHNTGFVSSLQMGGMTHPTCSPDLVPCDFHALTEHKIYLSVRQFYNDDEFYMLFHAASSTKE